VAFVETEAVFSSLPPQPDTSALEHTSATVATAIGCLMRSLNMRKSFAV
jgi:hypothetical protein